MTMFSTALRIAARRTARPCTNSPSAVLFYPGARIETETVMKTLIVATAAVAAATLLQAGPAQAYYDAPWCAVYTISPGGAVERCEFRNFESCRMEIIAGNRGFCRQNGYYLAGAAAHTPKTRKAR